MNFKNKLWNSHEDNELQILVRNYAGRKNWDKVSSDLSKFNYFKTAAQCRNRWRNVISSNLNKSKWSDEESRALFTLFIKYGNKWNVIADHLPGRNDIAVKNQIFNIIRRSLRKMTKVGGYITTTEQINDIRPKILTEIVTDDQGAIGCSGLIQKFAFTPFNEICQELNDKERLKINMCLSIIVKTNEDYINQTDHTGKRRIHDSDVFTTNRSYKSITEKLNSSDKTGTPYSNSSTNILDKECDLNSIVAKQNIKDNINAIHSLCDKICNTKESVEIEVKENLLTFFNLIQTVTNDLSKHLLYNKNIQSISEFNLWSEEKEIMKGTFDHLQSQQIKGFLMDDNDGNSLQLYLENNMDNESKYGAIPVGNNFVLKEHYNPRIDIDESDYKHYRKRTDFTMYEPEDFHKSRSDIDFYFSNGVEDSERDTALLIKRQTMYKFDEILYD